MSSAPPRLSVEELLDGIRSKNRAALGRAITLTESNLPAHQVLAQELLVRLLPFSGGALRVGITGVPGAGKSTFIEKLGTILTSRGHRVAVLAIDPSSTLTGGSILGDKTRMVSLSANPNAFIRPSPSGGSLGGVARKTRETIIVCEAAGFDVILVETVGVGQSETVVAGMVDFFLVLMIAGAGDELQGIKRGILELADLVAVNKADGDNLAKAQASRREFATALHYMRRRTPNWTPPVVACSSLTGEGLETLWGHVLAHREALERSGELSARRQQQQVDWTWQMVEEHVLQRLRQHPSVVSIAANIERAIRAQRTTPTMAAKAILEAFERE
jgi:LAO/AO transport system kinase